jgi:phosphoesterase RecJ-like protein
VAIFGHVRPDGDCAGSTLALYNYIIDNFPNTDVQVYLEKFPESYKILNGADKALPLFEGADGDQPYDAAILMDTPSFERAGAGGAEVIKAAHKTCNIDHHISNTGFGSHSYIVREASSTSELVYGFMDEDKIDVEIAKCIYTGIIHDTGILQYSNTSRKTLEIVGKLIEYGFNFTEIINSSYYEKTYMQNQIMGRAIMESILFMDGKCIVSVIDHKTMDFYGATSKDFDGIANQLYKTKGVECAIFMYESSHEQNLHKVSMRASDKVNVAEIAKKFGGGGHKKAAGFNMNGTYHDIINNISAEIEKQFKASEAE